MLKMLRQRKIERLYSLLCKKLQTNFVLRIDYKHLLEREERRSRELRELKEKVDTLHELMGTQGWVRYYHPAERGWQHVNGAKHPDRDSRGGGR